MPKTFIVEECVLFNSYPVQSCDNALSEIPLFEGELTRIKTFEKRMSGRISTNIESGFNDMTNL